MSGQTTYQPVFRNFTTDHGLPSPEVYNTIQDDDGFMWFVTDNGVSRYDGYNFENFGSEDGLLDNVILQVHKGKGGALWFVGMSGRIFIYDKGSFSEYAYNDLILSYPVPTVGLDLFMVHLKIKCI